MRHVICAMLLAAVIQAEEPVKLDRINLTNGRALIGTVASETGEFYVVSLAGGSGGSVQIAKSRVVSIDRGVEDAPLAQSTTPPTAAEYDAAKAAQPKSIRKEEKSVKVEEPFAMFTDRAVVRKFESGWVWVDAGAWRELDRDRKSKLIAEGAKVYGKTIEVHSFSDDRLLAWGSTEGAELSGNPRRVSTSGGFGGRW